MLVSKLLVLCTQNNNHWQKCSSKWLKWYSIWICMSGLKMPFIQDILVVLHTVHWGSSLYIDCMKTDCSTLLSIIIDKQVITTDLVHQWKTQKYYDWNFHDFHHILPMYSYKKWKVIVHYLTMEFSIIE